MRLHPDFGEWAHAHMYTYVEVWVHDYVHSYMCDVLAYFHI